jgi:hypothetical protein
MTDRHDTDRHNRRAGRALAVQPLSPALTAWLLVYDRLDQADTENPIQTLHQLLSQGCHRPKKCIRDQREGDH